MPRRLIDPAFWKSEKVASLSMMQRLLFLGIIGNADDQGRMKAHPSLVRSTVFPYDDISLDDMKAGLDAIAEIGGIAIYENDGTAYLQVLKWWEFQKLQWAQPSEYLPPPGWTDRVRCQRGDEYTDQAWDSPGGYCGEPGGEDVVPQVGIQVDEPGGDVAGGPNLTQLNSKELNGIQESGADAPCKAPPEPPQEPEPPQKTIPTNFPEWHSLVESAANQPAALMQMFEALYPGRTLPTFGYIGKAAHQVGGPGRLADLMWQHSTRPPTGDVLAFLQGVVKRKKARAGGQSAARLAQEESIAHYLEAG